MLLNHLSRNQIQAQSLLIMLNKDKSTCLNATRISEKALISNMHFSHIKYEILSEISYLPEILHTDQFTVNVMVFSFLYLLA